MRVQVKNRAMVRGGGRKPWAQKGSGRARAGSRRCSLTSFSTPQSHPLYRHCHSSLLFLSSHAPVFLPVPPPPHDLSFVSPLPPPWSPFLSLHSALTPLFLPAQDDTTQCSTVQRAREWEGGGRERARAIDRESARKCVSCGCVIERALPAAQCAKADGKPLPDDDSPAWGGTHLGDGQTCGQRTTSSCRCAAACTPLRPLSRFPIARTRLAAPVVGCALFRVQGSGFRLQGLGV